jgi:predicted transcriptional regulator of viral defense system
MSLTQTEVINQLLAKNIVLLDIDDLQRLFAINDRNTLHKLTQRLTRSGVLERLKRGQYLFRHAGRTATDYQLANFLIGPSYISLESALAYYDLIDQFPYPITSITTRKSKTLTVRGKTFAYSSITPRLYWGYQKEADFLIATPEKTVIDFIYLSGKTDRRPPTNIRIEGLDKGRLNKYLHLLDSDRYARELQKLGLDLERP